MKTLFRLLRWPLGQLIIFIDWITCPKMPDYSADRRAELDGATRSMQLYHFKQCPFCVRTRRSIRRLGLNIETRDARNIAQWKNELSTEGGKYQVPCLRIQDEDQSIEWMYGSKNIIDYLDQRFDVHPALKTE